MTRQELLGLPSANLETDSSTASIKLESIIRNNAQVLDAAMQRVFSPEHETRQAKARRIMGTSLANVADEELELYLTELQYMIDWWLDAFERQSFDGETLKELIG